MREEVTSRTVKSNALNEAPLPRAGDRDRTHGAERRGRMVKHKPALHVE